jgi:hypothetical protein
VRGAAEPARLGALRGLTNMDMPGCMRGAAEYTRVHMARWLRTGAEQGPKRGPRSSSSPLVRSGMLRFGPGSAPVRNQVAMLTRSSVKTLAELRSPNMNRCKALPAEVPTVEVGPERANEPAPERVSGAAEPAGLGKYGHQEVARDDIRAADVFFGSPPSLGP